MYFSIFDCLVALFENFERDPRGNYKPENVNVYYENKLTGKCHKVDQNKTIRDILEEET